jgi:hypothetical protein
MHENTYPFWYYILLSCREIRNYTACAETRERERYYVDRLIFASTANHYDSAWFGSLIAVLQRKNSYQKIIKVWYWEISIQFKNVFS